MLTAIQFDDEFLAWGTEVHDVVADGVLVPKMDVAHAMCSQVYPELGFGGSLFAVQLFGACEDFGCGAFMQLDPLPTSPN